MLPHENYHSLEHFELIGTESFVINWTFFNACNYSCSYCEPRLYDGSHKALDFEVYIKFIDRVFEIKNDKKVVFNFTGGEITLYPKLKEILEYIKSKGGYSILLTNGSKPLIWWDDIIPLVEQVCLSYHSESVDDESFFEVAKNLSKRIGVHVNCMMHIENFDAIYNFAQKLTSSIPDISLELQPLFDNFSGPRFPYSSQQLTIMENPEFDSCKTDGKEKRDIFRGDMKKVFQDGREQRVTPTSLIVKEQNIWFGWNCYVGVENIVIGMDGSIRNSVCKIGGVIGWITDENLKLPEKPVVCMKRKCTCAFDITATKSKK